MRIMAVGAHPDDCELRAGGTLAKYSKAGHEVFTVSVTNGEIGSNLYGMEELAKMRKAEAAAAAKVIGGEFICMDYRDQRFIIDNEVRMAFVALFRYVNPDVVLTHCQDDFSADHRLVGQIVNEISMLPMVPNIVTNYQCTHKAPVLYYWMSSNNIGVIPEQFVDISDVIDTKVKMLECYKSQVEWLAYHCKRDMIADNLVDSKFRGQQASVEHAEAFVMVKAAPRACCGTLLP